MGRTQLLLLAVIVLSTLSCSKNKEMEDLAKAQKCLDEVSESNPESAASCMQYVEKHSSQQANILKCAIKMTSGGLMESKIVAAYNAMEDNSIANKEAAFMTALSLDLPDVTTAYATAVDANDYCQASGLPGLRYLSGLVVSGTYANMVIETLTGNPIDITDPAAIDTAVDALLNACTGSPPDPACTADLATVGTVVTTLAQSYCNGSNADANACKEINDAVDAAGGDAAAVGQALFCYLGGKTYNIITGECNP